ncbi:DNA recombination protein RmuC [Gilvimarinus agarilyticus]|uniref:DNA recombination protein RmuC n=1 Tax=Gilvimarinus agarilyticus TaxID=679259 RepID=UPI000ACEF3F6|nr:DNA recombination protein RmuC [Gilvimarinus agarilyticus]
MMSEFLARPELLVPALVAFVSVCSTLLIAYLMIKKPLERQCRALEVHSAELQHAHALAESEWGHKVVTRERELAVKEQELTQLRQRQQQLEQARHQAHDQAARLQERLSHFEQLSQRVSEQETRIVELSQERTQLQTQLASERESLAQQAQFLERSKAELKQEFELTANKLFERKSEQFSAASQGMLEGTLSPFKTQLQEFRKKVEDVYEKENAERSRLSGQIFELQKQAHKIGEDAVNLAQALKGSNKAQGGWGEIVLERLLEQSGLQKGREYDTQVNFAADDGRRRIPDVVVHLPEGKDIIIDAKVSLTDYERYCSCEDEAERQQYLHKHIQSLRSHIKSLSAKDYEQLPGIKALDFVFIFIPIEAAFMLAMQYDSNLYKEAYDRHIILASPSTLLAILRTVDNVWRYEKQNKNAERIATEAGSLHDQFVLLLEAMEAIGAQLNKTQDAYQTAHKRLATGRGNLVKRVDNIRRLGAKTKKSIDSPLLELADDDLATGDDDE